MNVLPDLTIRPARVEDAAAITAIHCSTTQTWIDPVTRRPTPYEALDLYGRWRNGGPWMSVETCTAHLTALLSDGHPLLVAELEGQVVGEAEYLIAREAGPFASLHLSILYVHAAYQGRGVGQALVAAGSAEARAHELPALTTQPEEAAIESFYARLGFAPWHIGKEMQLSTRGGVPPTGLRALCSRDCPAEDLALRIGRYQCGVQAWEVLWPRLPLPEWQKLRRRVWAVDLAGVPAVLGLCEQLTDPTQADGYAWLPPESPLAPAVAALQRVGAEEGFTAVDLLLPEPELSELKKIFRLDYQTRVALWRKEPGTTQGAPPRRG
jgi:GNAT superfamily N-acetyltransferase